MPPQNDIAGLLGFAKSLVHDHALPVLAAGYTKLVQSLRQNEALARRARQEGLSAILDSGDLAELRKNNKELVTAAEKEAESLMASKVLARYPTHAIVGEEHGYRPGSSMRWVFDPIDGTSAMIRTAMAEAFGVKLGKPAPSFGVTVGVTEGDEAILGVVVELRPLNGTLVAVNTWAGGKGQPVTCNDVVIHAPAAPATLAEATLACTVPEIMFNTKEKWSGFQALLDATEKPCVTDQNCVGFMRLLDPVSTISLAFEGDLGYHDVAALVPILVGAGLTATDDKGQKLTFPEGAIKSEYRILAAAPALHAAALKKIHEGVPDNQNRFKTGGDIHEGYAQKFPGKA
jgi:fructose-1,6-bisphosphatase/inositol monophosphatase family enzyme